MPHFENVTLGCTFDLPDPLTLGDYERYERAKFDALGKGASTNLSLRWIGARELVQSWQCETLPDPRANPDSICGAQLRVIAWAGLEVERYVNGIVAVPKN